MKDTHQKQSKASGVYTSESEQGGKSVSAQSPSSQDNPEKALFAMQVKRQKSNMDEVMLREAAAAGDVDGVTDLLTRGVYVHGKEKRTGIISI